MFQPRRRARSVTSVQSARRVSLVMPGTSAASRAWGQGAIDWPSRSSKVYVHQKAPEKRLVHIMTNFVDEEGRIKTGKKKTELVLEAMSKMTIIDIKTLLAQQMASPVPAERMRFIIRGAEVSNEQLLEEVSPTAADVEVLLQVRRRGVPPPQPPPPDPNDENDLRTVPTHDPYSDTPPPALEPPPPPPPPPLSCLHVRTMCGGSKSALVECTAETDLRTFREAVAKLPLTLQSWREDPKAEAAEAAGDAKKKEEKKDPKAAAAGGEADGPPVEAVLLLGVGDDLEIPEGAADGTAQTFEGSRLVHLRDTRDGKVDGPKFVLGDYGLVHGSIVYFVLEGRG